MVLGMLRWRDWARGTGSSTGSRIARLALLMVLAVPAVAAESVAEQGPSRDDIEEITVTAPRPEKFELPDVEFVIETYSSRRKGAELYNDGHYEEAFPHLLAAAQRGFKMAQARVGYLYLSGLGVEQDVETAIVWLSVASRGSTAPEIRNYLRPLWEKIPASYVPELNERIEEYDAIYGAKVNRVGCDFSQTTRSRIKKLSCRYMDQCRYWTTAATPELQDCPEWFDL